MCSSGDYTIARYGDVNPYEQRKQTEPRSHASAHQGVTPRHQRDGLPGFRDAAHADQGLWKEELPLRRRSRRSPRPLLRVEQATRWSSRPQHHHREAGRAHHSCDRKQQGGPEAPGYLATRNRGRNPVDRVWQQETQPSKITELKLPANRVREVRNVSPDSGPHPPSCELQAQVPSLLPGAPDPTPPPSSNLCPPDSGPLAPTSALRIQVPLLPSAA